YDRDESFQLLLTFALVLMFQDVFKFVWGANPRSHDSGYLIYGTTLRATAENRAMAEALGVDVRRIYVAVFTLGAVLGTTAGALVVPTAAASLDMAIEFVIEAFAVVVIGGLGSMRHGRQRDRAG